MFKLYIHQATTYFLISSWQANILSPQIVADKIMKICRIPVCTNSSAIKRLEIITLWYIIHITIK